MTRSGGRAVGTDGENPAEVFRLQQGMGGVEAVLFAVARDEELVKLIGLVQSIGRDVYRRLGGRIEFDDLVGEGYLALVRCRDRFDPKAGASLSTFAYRRIEGAMLDLARKERWFSDSRYQTGGLAESFRDLLDSTAGDAESEGGGPGTDARFAAQAVGRSTVVTLIRRATDEDVSERVERSELRALLADAFGRLSDQDRLVLRRLWFEGRTLSELGREIGVSKEYARRLDMRALDRLRRLMMSQPMSSCDPVRDGGSGASGGTPAEKG